VLDASTTTSGAVTTSGLPDLGITLGILLVLSVCNERVTFMTDDGGIFTGISWPRNTVIAPSHK
jgi:hypothetical protein